MLLHQLHFKVTAAYTHHHCKHCQHHRLFVTQTYATGSARLEKAALHTDRQSIISQVEFSQTTCIFPLVSFLYQQHININTYSEIIPEQLHYERAVLVRVFVECIQLGNCVIKSLLVHTNTVWLLQLGCYAQSSKFSQPSGTWTMFSGRLKAIQILHSAGQWPLSSFLTVCKYLGSYCIVSLLPD